SQSRRPALNKASDRAYFFHFGNEMPQKVLDAVFQCRRRARAAGTRALHIQEYHTVLVAIECDIAPVLGNARPNTCIEQLLDGRDDLPVVWLEVLRAGR